MRICRSIHIIGCVGIGIIVSGVMWGVPALGFASTQVEMEQPLYFSGPDGDPIQLAPAKYDISYPGGERLIFAQGEKEPLTIQARPGTHSEPLNQPKAVLVQDEDDATVMWVMYLMPDGTGWESMGSTTGIQTRGRLRLSKRKRNFSRILRYKNRKGGSPSTQKPKSPIPPTIPVPGDCPGMVHQSIAGYPSGVTDPLAAPEGSSNIEAFVSEVLRSYRPGCWPISIVLIMGRSDKSPGGIQVDDYISIQRAQEAKNVLKERFKTRAQGMAIPSGYPNPANMGFIVGGIGSREVAPDGPAQDPDNRRVKLLSYTIPMSVENKVNRPGGDFEQHQASDYFRCSAICSQIPKCRAYTFVKPVPPKTEGTCFLKNRVPRPTRDAKAISGVVVPARQ